MTDQQQHGQERDEADRGADGSRPEPDQHNAETEEDTASGGPA